MNTSGESLIPLLLWSGLFTVFNVDKHFFSFVRSLGGTDNTFLAAYPDVDTMRVSDLLEPNTDGAEGVGMAHQTKGTVAPRPVQSRLLVPSKK
jgi:hypothetical protein